MDAEKKVYETRVIPFVTYNTIIKNGKKREVVNDNLTVQECRNMSCESKLLRLNSQHVYEIVDTPLIMNNSFTGIRGLLCYVYDELTPEEQKKYFSRSKVILTTIESVVKNDAKAPRKLFGKIKMKQRR